MKTTALLFAGCFVSAGFLRAQIAPAETQPPVAAPPEPAMTPEQTSALMEQITKTRNEFAKAKRQVFEGALTRFRAASASEADAVNFYLACYQVVNIDRKPAASEDEQKEREKDDWRERIIEQMKDTRTPGALRLQLQLLALMLEASQAEDRSKFIQPLRAFCQSAGVFLQSARAEVDAEPQRRVVATVGKKGRRDELNDQRDKMRDGRVSGAARSLGQGVMGTLFAQAYNLSTYIEHVEGWPQSALDFRSVYRNIVLPHCRVEKKGLAEAWQEYVNLETILRQSEANDDAFQEWGRSGYRDLMWEKWLDLLMNGVNANTAGQELLKIIRENPTSPSLKKWMHDLDKIADKIAPPAPAPEVPPPQPVQP
jgi:hypothetical protein